MRRNLYPTLIAAALSALSCTTFNEGSDKVPEDTAPLALSVRMAEAPTKTLITGKMLSEGAEIGVALLGDDGQPYCNLPYSNVRFTARGGGNSQEWVPETDVMLAAAKASLHAYYPYSEQVDDIRSIPVQAGSESQADYLYGGPVNNLYNKAPEAAVTMKHALSAVRLSIKRGGYSGKGEMTGFSIKGHGVATDGILNAVSGKISETSGTGTAISPSFQPFDLSSSFQDIDIIAVPTTEEAPIEMEMVIDGQTFSFTTDPVRLEQGSIAVYKATVENSEIRLSSVQIEDWGYDSAGNPMIRNDWTVTLSGDIEGISFSNSIEDNGTIRIIAVPVSADSEVNTPIVTGEATVTETVDHERGTRTIILSDIRSDVIVQFDGLALWTTAKYMIEDISSPVKIINNAGFGTLAVNRILVDGEEKTPSTRYQFESPGVHTVRFAFRKYVSSGQTLAKYHIPEAAFKEIATLTEIIIPEGYTLMRNQTFFGCTGLTSVSLPSSMNQMGYSTFYDCSSLKSIEFPDGITAFYDHVCFGCSSLEKVKLPSGLTRMGESAFQGCSALAEIDLPSSMTNIGYGAFKYSGLTKLHIPDGVSRLESHLCMSSRKLKEVKLPENLKEFGKMVFYDCTSLNTVIQADGTVHYEEFSLPEGVESIGEMIIMECPFKSMHIPSTLTSIDIAGAACNHLEQYTISPDNEAYEVRNNCLIDRSTGILFSGCIGSVIDRSVSIIGKKAFYSCPKETIDLHDGITEIQNEAFLNATPSVIISRALTPPSLQTRSFNVARYNGTLKVPASALDAYKEEWMIDQAGYLGWDTARWSIQALKDGE